MAEYRTRDCECRAVIGMGGKRPKVCEHGHPYLTEAELKPRERTSSPRRLAQRSATPATPRWLTEGFALGVDQREAAEAVRSAEPYGCWLAQFDPEERPCTNTLERCHIINRQRLGCTGHHPRFDSNATPPLVVPFECLPDHVLEFAEDWGLEDELERKCPKAESNRTAEGVQAA